MVWRSQRWLHTDFTYGGGPTSPREYFIQLYSRKPNKLLDYNRSKYQSPITSKRNPDNKNKTVSDLKDNPAQAVTVKLQWPQAIHKFCQVSASSAIIEIANVTTDYRFIVSIDALMLTSSGCLAHLDRITGVISMLDDCVRSTEQATTSFLVDNSNTNLLNKMQIILCQS